MGPDLRLTQAPPSWHSSLVDLMAEHGIMTGDCQCLCQAFNAPYSITCVSYPQSAEDGPYPVRVIHSPESRLIETARSDRPLQQTVFMNRWLGFHPRASWPEGRGAAWSPEDTLATCFTSFRPCWNQLPVVPAIGVVEEASDVVWLHPPVRVPLGPVRSRCSCSSAIVVVIVMLDVIVEGYEVNPPVLVPLEITVAGSAITADR